MKVAVYQTNPKLLDVKANLDDVIDKIREGKANGADLIVFPELALTGYFVGDRYHEMALRLDSHEINYLKAETKGTAAVVGFIEESRSMNFYNSALVAVDGEILYAYRKLNLPNYGVFEERKIFASGKRIPVFRHKDLTIAVLICNDLWHPSLPYLGVCQKADIFVNLFNSTHEGMGTEFSNIESWKIITMFYSRIFGVYNISANRVGTETFGNRCVQEDAGSATAPKRPDVIRYHFWGGSSVVNPFGKIIIQAKMDQLDVIYSEIDRDLVRQKRILLPYLRNDDPLFYPP